MTAPILLRGVDRAAFAVALVVRLRSGSVAVSASGSTGFVAALDHLAPASRRDLYWAARLTLVNRAEDLVGFDAVFGAVFADAVLGLDPVSLRSSRGSAAASVPGVRGAQGPTLDGSGLPWATRPTSITVTRLAELTETDIAIPDTLPSRWVARADDAFETFDEEDLRIIGTWLEQATAGLAAPSQPTARTQQPWDPDRSSPDDAGVTHHRVGGAAAGPVAAPGTPPPGRISVRRQQIDAALRDHLSAPDAGGGRAEAVRSSHPA